MCCRVFKLPKSFCFLLLCACSTGDGTEGGHGGENYNIRKALPGRPERNHLNPWPERQARERAGHQGLTLPTGTPTLNQACADWKFISSLSTVGQCWLMSHNAVEMFWESCSICACAYEGRMLVRGGLISPKAADSCWNLSKCFSTLWRGMLGGSRYRPTVLISRSISWRKKEDSQLHWCQCQFGPSVCYECSGYKYLKRDG